jgi:hypothetical protein
MALRSNSPNSWMDGMWLPEAPARTSSVPRPTTSLTNGTRVTAARATPQSMAPAGQTTRRTTAARPGAPRAASHSAHAPDAYTA